MCLNSMLLAVRPFHSLNRARVVDVGFGFRRLKVTVRGEKIMDIELAGPGIRADFGEDLNEI